MNSPLISLEGDFSAGTGFAGELVQAPTPEALEQAQSLLVESGVSLEEVQQLNWRELSARAFSIALSKATSPALPDSAVQPESAVLPAETTQPILQQSPLPTLVHTSVPTPLHTRLTAPILLAAAVDVPDIIEPEQPAQAALPTVIDTPLVAEWSTPTEKSPLESSSELVVLDAGTDEAVEETIEDASSVADSTEGMEFNLLSTTVRQDQPAQLGQPAAPAALIPSQPAPVQALQHQANAESSIEPSTESRTLPAIDSHNPQLTMGLQADAQAAQTLPVQAEKPDSSSDQAQLPNAAKQLAAVSAPADNWPAVEGSNRRSTTSSEALPKPVLGPVEPGLPRALTIQASVPVASQAAAGLAFARPAQSQPNIAWPTAEPAEPEFSPAQQALGWVQDSQDFSERLRTGQAVTQQSTPLLKGGADVQSLQSPAPNLALLSQGTSQRSEQSVVNPAWPVLASKAEEPVLPVQQPNSNALVLSQPVLTAAVLPGSSGIAVPPPAEIALSTSRADGLQAVVNEALKTIEMRLPGRVELSLMLKDGLRLDLVVQAQQQRMDIEISGSSAQMTSDLWIEGADGLNRTLDTLGYQLQSLRINGETVQATGAQTGAGLDMAQQQHQQRGSGREQGFQPGARTDTAQEDSLPYPAGAAELPKAGSSPASGAVSLYA